MYLGFNGSVGGYKYCPRCGVVVMPVGGRCPRCGYRFPVSRPTVVSRENVLPGKCLVRVGERVGVGGSVYLCGDDLLRGVAIMGLPGSGKTSMSRRIIFEAASRVRGLGVVVMDVEGEYRELASVVGAKVVEPGDGSSLGMLDWRSYGVSVERAASLASEVLIDVLARSGAPFADTVLSPAAQSLVRRGVHRAVREGIVEWGRFLDVMDSLASSRAEAAAVEGVRRRFELIGGRWLDWLFGRDSLGFSAGGFRAVFGLEEASRQASYAVLSLVGRKLLSSHSVLREESLRALVVVEEGELFVPSGGEGLWVAPSVVTGLSLEGRKRGIGLVMVMHSPALVERSVLRGMGTFLVFRLRDRGDVSAVSQMLGNRSLGDIVMMLPRGEFLFSSYSMPSVVRVKGDGLFFSGANSYMPRIIGLLREKGALSISELRGYLGVSGKVFARSIRPLLDYMRRQGIIDVSVVNTGGRGRRPVVVGLPSSNPGFVHGYLERRVVEAVRRVYGVEPVVEGVGPDVVVELEGLEVCIEVETGSNLLVSKYESFRERCGFLVVVCSSSKCKSRAGRIAGSFFPPTMYRVILLEGLEEVLRDVERRCLYRPRRAALSTCVSGGLGGGRIRLYLRGEEGQAA